MEFDENTAIKYMRSAVAPELNNKYTDDDELLNLIDLVYDYLEANGMLEIDVEDDDDELDIDDLMAYIGRMLKKDKGANLTEKDARPYVEAYFDYESSLDS